MEEQVFDEQKAEQLEIGTLLDKGMKFEVKYETSFFGFLKKDKVREFVINEQYLGTLDFLADEFIQMRFIEEELKENHWEEGKRMIKADAYRCARVVAIAILNKKDLEKEVQPLADFLFWNVTPRKLLEICKIIFHMSNIINFCASIGLMSIKQRTTAPTPIEKNTNTPA